jgi:hypothetical protein
VETPEIHEKMLENHQTTVQQSTGSPGSGSGRHHQHPNSHHTGNMHHNHHHPSSAMEAFSNTTTKQYHPKDYYTQKWINNPKMGLPLPPTPMEDTNHRNHHQHGTSGLTGSQLMNFRWLTKQTKISAYLNSFLEDLGFQV